MTVFDTLRDRHKNNVATLVRCKKMMKNGQNFIYSF